MDLRDIDELRSVRTISFLPTPSSTTGNGSHRFTESETDSVRKPKPLELMSCLVRALPVLACCDRETGWSSEGIATFLGMLDEDVSVWDQDRRISTEKAWCQDCLYRAADLFVLLNPIHLDWLAKYIFMANCPIF